MNVLVACEESQTVCKAFRAAGHNAFSCDIQDCSGGHPEWHIKGDVLPLLNGRCVYRTMDGSTWYQRTPWDLIIAHPPCTDLANSGAKWFAQKRADGRQQSSIDFFMKFTNIDCPRVCIENPIGIMSTVYRKPDQFINPFQFGDAYEKKTCLWLKGLPVLKPTDIVEPEPRQYFPSGKSLPTWYSRCGGNRAKARSKTFPGIAQAMADQWGKEV